MVCCGKLTLPEKGYSVHYIIKNLATFSEKNLIYKPNYTDMMNHLIAHECGHILRLFTASSDKRLMASTNNKTKEIALSEIQNDLLRLNNIFGFDKMASITNIWYTGIIRQLTNYPPDIMIEKWIFNQYPSLRPYQQQSIQLQFNDAISGAKPEVKNITPSKIYNASNLMNYAFFRILGMMIGINFIRSYSSVVNLNEGKALALIIENSKNDNFENDIELINSWASFLSMNKWFEWIAFELIPPDYLSQ